jgi:hypothetical protein
MSNQAQENRVGKLGPQKKTRERECAVPKITT